MSKSSRSMSRELVLQSLYALESEGGSSQEVMATVLESAGLNERHLHFSKQLFNMVIEQQEWANGRIDSLSENWSLKRIAQVDRIIMRMAMIEIKNMSDVPMKVVLNEAIELAKKFSTAESSRFINGILDQFARVHLSDDLKTTPDGDTAPGN